MTKTSLLTVLLVCFGSILNAQSGEPFTSETTPEVAYGSIERIPDFSSDYVPPRTVDIWLPDGYSKDKQYSVLYMHDGQMLFDKNVGWNKQEWEVDEHAGELLKNGKIKDCIIVGIYNIPDLRFAEYFPQKAYKYLPENFRERFSELVPGNLAADNYLRFIVNELKPYIDKNYSTLTDAGNTVIAGSSMGGLISLYAVCEYPEVFSRAACLSIHSLMVIPGMADETENDIVPAAFRVYLQDHLPAANSRYIYMDYGDQTLDELYAPYQQRIDEVMKQKGWKEPYWQTRFYPGTGHSEVFWAQRMDIPLLFLLGK